MLFAMLIENWFVPNDVTVRTGRLCDRAVNVIAMVSRPQAAVANEADQLFFMVFIFQLVLIIFKKQGWQSGDKWVNLQRVLQRPGRMRLNFGQRSSLGPSKPPVQ